MTVPPGASNNDLWRLLDGGAASGKTDRDYLQEIVSGRANQTMNDLLKIWVGSTSNSWDDDRSLLQKKLILNGGSYKPGATENNLLRALVSLI